MGIVVDYCWVCVRNTILNVWFIAFLIPFIVLKYWLESRRKTLEAKGRLDGQTYIVTGCNKSVGFLTALELAKRGARVLMACRNLGSAHLAKNAIVYLSGNEDVDVYRLDLSSFWSVKQFAKDVLENEGRLDGIILNAGVGIVKNKLTKDGIPLIWQINHYSPFMMVQLLYGLLKKSKEGQIIFVTSSAHHFSKFDGNDLMCEKKKCPWTVYCDTKLANILTANTLAEKMKDTGITVNSVNPGLVNTQLLRRFRNYYLQSIVGSLLDFYGKSEVDGAATTLTVALDPSLKSVTGKYFSNCKESSCVSRKVKDRKLAERLWEQSKQMTGLKPDEISIS
uniref:Dehydrogenase/reductase SDR family member 13 n=1 Tax=Lygus hesperus TaxID=30085 RepID=A0A0A9YYT8_LYGHE